MPPQPQQGPQLLSDRIRAQEFRLVDGDENRIVSRSEALRLAEERNLDLLVVSMASSPPVIRLVDYGKFKFESEKKAREQKKKQHTVDIKEVKLGVRIDQHDLEVKLKRARGFLEAGHKVKFTIRLRGREIQHPELAQKLAEKLVENLADVGAQENRIRTEGRQIIVVLGSKKK